MIRKAILERLAMGMEGRYNPVAACMGCGHFINVENIRILSSTPCPYCGKICYQDSAGDTHKGKNEGFELTGEYISEKNHAMFMALKEMNQRLGPVDQIAANLEKTAVESARITTWLWEHHDPIIFYGFFDALRQGGAGEFADIMEKASDFNHRNLEKDEDG